MITLQDAIETGKGSIAFHNRAQLAYESYLADGSLNSISERVNEALGFDGTAKYYLTHVCAYMFTLKDVYYLGPETSALCRTAGIPQYV